MLPDPARIGRFVITGRLGEGGMGVVYTGVDELLQRPVAVKVLRDPGDPSASARLLREARSAARINHPNICGVLEAGEESGSLYIAMELLEGESLLARLGRGPMPANEAGACMLAILDALEAIHAHGLVHRDVKPSNVFLTRHGPKLLDFGLAREGSRAGETAAIDSALTVPGMVLGTPRYMAPEQWGGADLSAATDLFAAGALLFEMITGTAAFRGDSVFEVFEAITRGSPPVLGGGAAVAALDRVVQRSLAKRPEDRYRSATDMAGDLQAALAQLEDRTEIVQIRRTTRFIALPLRVLRSDPETDYLGASLADAISASLSGFDTLLVRSSALARKLAGETDDVRAIGRAADVDILLTGNMMRAGERIRVTAQLVDASHAAVLWSKTIQAPLGDLFELEDDLVHQIVDSLAVPLTARDRKRLGREAPASPRAYELFLRANQVTYGSAFARPLLQARDLYRFCVEEDPRFAPAWARLGRVHRILAKYGHDEPDENYRLARESLARALELDPDLSIAHNYYTYMQVEEGHALEAMVRLLARVESRATDAELFAALVVACRFCGLLEPSLAAAERARRLDPNQMTSVIYTHLMLGNYDTVIAEDPEVPAVCRMTARSMMGRDDDVLAELRSSIGMGLEGVERIQLEHTLAVLEGRIEEAMAQSRQFQVSRFQDPEGIYFVARTDARAGDREGALRLLDIVVGRGYWCSDMLRRDPWLASLRGDARFDGLLRDADAGRARARDAYVRGGGPRLLGVRV